MHRWGVIIAVILASALAGGAPKDATLEETVARADAAPLGDRPSLYVEIAERQLKSADDFYTAGKVDEAQAAVKDVVTYSEKAHDTALQSGKKLKGTEIATRKMSAKLRDIKRTLSFDDQPPVQAAADRLETLRTDLLGKMFGKGK